MNKNKSKNHSGSSSTNLSGFENPKGLKDARKP